MPYGVMLYVCPDSPQCKSVEQQFCRFFPDVGTLFPNMYVLGRFKYWKQCVWTPDSLENYGMCQCFKSIFFRVKVNSVAVIFTLDRL